MRYGLKTIGHDGRVDNFCSMYAPWNNRNVLAAKQFRGESFLVILFVPVRSIRDSVRTQKDRSEDEPETKRRARCVDPLVEATSGHICEQHPSILGPENETGNRALSALTFEVSAGRSVLPTH